MRPGFNFIKLKCQFRHFKCQNMGILNALRMPLFGNFNANISNENSKFWCFKSQKCFMKLPKSYTPFLAFKYHNWEFKMLGFSVYEIDT